MMTCLETRKVLLHMTLGATIGSEKVALHRIEQLLRAAGVQRDVIEDIKTMAAEGCLNAIEHGCKQGSDDLYEIEMAREVDDIVLRVRDKGRRVWDKGPHHVSTGGGSGGDDGDFDPLRSDASGHGADKRATNLHVKDGRNISEVVPVPTGVRTNATPPLTRCSVGDKVAGLAHDTAHDKMANLMANDEDGRGWGLILIDALSDSWTLRRCGDCTQLEFRVHLQKDTGGITLG